MRNCIFVPENQIPGVAKANHIVAIFEETVNRSLLALVPRSQSHSVDEESTHKHSLLRAHHWFLRMSNAENNHGLTKKKKKKDSSK